jgi:hypothetical protein
MKLVLGEEIVKRPIPKDEYWVHITFMHGDADSYDTENWSCDDELEAMLHYELHMLARNLGSSGRDVNDLDEENIKEVLTRYKEAGCKMMQSEDPEHMKSSYYDEVPGDCTCDGQRKADVDEVWITYFDKDGAEFKVVVTE